ncbi:MAG: sterol desaturase family protein [Bacteroidia bacterium]|nr:sterol desaturase family protein [Bacteroidia bacterium]
MAAYAKALLIAIPGFLLLILIEALYGHFVKNQTLTQADTIASLSSGMTNIVKDSLKLILMILPYSLLVNYFSITTMENSTWVYIIAFIALDFSSYWIHRISHSINLFWNKHAVHHSSEEFNLPAALRQSISNLLGIWSIFLLPAALLGISPQVIAILAPLHLFMQFWYHTKHIPKLGFLEYLIVTPSQHRVHHAINPEYLDKNLGAIFPWWDRMFGTFQEELDDVPPVYGITRPMSTWNPVKINFKHVGLLFMDAWRTKNIWDKFRIWFMPLGWRPADVIEKYPVHKIEDVYNFEKYNPEMPKGLMGWSWFQLSMTFLLLIFMFWQFVEINFPMLFYYGAFLFVGVYGFTSLMDRDKEAVFIEVIRGLAGISWILINGDWFGIGKLIPFGQWIILFYFGLTAIGGIYFRTKKDVPEKQKFEVSKA